MRRNGSKSAGFTAAMGCVILLLCLAATAYCEQQSAALMLEVSPLRGGTVNLSQGVHTYDRDAEVTLIATPNPGYQFVYWLGDVTNAAASTTMVYLDAPKIVIAVFERAKFELIEPGDELQGSAGGGGLVPSGGNYAAALEQATGGKRPPHWHLPKLKKGDVPVPKDDEGDVPVPKDDEDDVPVPVPEPATIVFIFTGMLALARRRRREVEVRQ
jgi:hypothetical protein